MAPQRSACVPQACNTRVHCQVNSPPNPQLIRIHYRTTACTRARSMIISTKPYTESELAAILAIRAEEEDVAMTAEAAGLLTKIAKETSLRYAMHMIMCAALVAKQRRAGEVDKEDIRRVFSLFSDLRRSTQFLLEFNSQFMFNELGEEEEAEGEGKAPAAAGAGAGASSSSASSSAAAMDTS